MHVRSRKGFSAIELLVVIAIIGIMAAIAIPWWLTYWPAATVRGAARDLQGGLNQAKMLAITTRQNIRVDVVAGGYRFWQLGAVPPQYWVGAGNDGTGLFRAPDTVTFTGAANPIFTQFGTVGPGQGTVVLTVTGPSNRTLTVTILPSGRVTIP